MSRLVTVDLASSAIGEWGAIMMMRRRGYPRPPSPAHTPLQTPAGWLRRGRRGGA
ncbi:hypothetical protein I4F81_001620 [Pyropia yezoensis]|uniref:Uncharacterized protein n=1 Tax=Pyropia yezoensis TaxID=2788 RepID=A0ACC3BM83_PYRYE|nr:hypothetical protein I4F81_001620 [Neopyropia yezoensis]